MTTILKKCVTCGKEFITLFGRECEVCQRKYKSSWSLKGEKERQPTTKLTVKRLKDKRNESQVVIKSGTSI